MHKDFLLYMNIYILQMFSTYDPRCRFLTFSCDESKVKHAVSLKPLKMLGLLYHFPSRTQSPFESQWVRDLHSL